MNALILTLFNCLGDGIAIISDAGKVRFANEAMLKLLPAKVGNDFPHATVAAVIAHARDGHLPLPHGFDAELAYDLHVSAPDRLRVHLVRSPAGRDLIVVLRNLSESARCEATFDNFGALVDSALADSLHRFSARLSGLLADMADPASGPAALSTGRDAVVAHGEDMIAQLRNLAGLAQLARGRALAADDRIVLEHWLAEVLARHAGGARARGQRLTLERAARPLPAIYGSAHWLGLALDACLDNAIRHSGHGCDVALSALACGSFVRIVVRNMGRGLQPALLRRRLMQPLVRGRSASEAGPGLGLGLPLARHVVELHHGRLELDQELDGFVTCTIELPTGARPRTSTGLDPAQAQRYAADLVRLVAGRARHAQTSPS